MKNPRADAVVSAHVTLKRALYPYEDVRTREGIDRRVQDKWSEASRLLTQAEDKFDTGVGGGEPDVAEGLRLAATAREAIEWTRGLRGTMDKGLQEAFARVLRTLDGLLA